MDSLSEQLSKFEEELLYEIKDPHFLSSSDSIEEAYLQLELWQNKFEKFLISHLGFEQTKIFIKNKMNIFQQNEDIDLLIKQKKQFQKYIRAIKQSSKNHPELYKPPPIIESYSDITTKSILPSLNNKNKIFVVHGHDEALKESVARFLTKFSLEPIILHERPNNGQTIIEKFERNTLDVDFAIVLLTPDDVGGIYDETAEESLYSRARQNVILELGYFIGKLGRGRVAALNKGVEELPSDFFGVAYISVLDNSSWQMPLAQELKSAGYEIDLNKLFDSVNA